MFLREKSTTTLADVADEWSTDRNAYWGGPLSNVSVALVDVDQPTIRLGDHEVRANENGLLALGGYLDVPAAFLKRITPEEQQWILNRRIENTGENNVSTAYTTEGGLVEVVKSGARRIDPRQIAEVALNVMPEDSSVTDYWSNLTELRLDVIVPEDFRQGWGGDKKVGDITGGGVRLFQDRKNNLVPTVNPFLFRLACTNGYEVMDSSLKFDARGMEVDDVIASLEQETRRAFARVEADIASFYDTRTQKITADQTGVLRQIGLDAGLPERTVGRLEDSLPGMLEAEDITDATMFDFINTITNYANTAGLPRGTARSLQRVGGSLIDDHTARCNKCHQKVR